MPFTENAVARWAELQRLQTTSGRQLTTTNPWVLALFREALPAPGRRAAGPQGRRAAGPQGRSDQ